jgi:hypothetical protein
MAVVVILLLFGVVWYLCLRAGIYLSRKTDGPLAFETCPACSRHMQVKRGVSRWNCPGCGVGLENPEMLPSQTKVTS